MQINDVSGVIYQYSDSDKTSVGSVRDSGGDFNPNSLQGNTVNSMSLGLGLQNSQLSQNYPDENGVQNFGQAGFETTQEETNSTNNGNHLRSFDGMNNGLKGNYSNTTIDTSIDRTIGIKLEQDTDKILADYREKLLAWKDKKKTANIVDSFGLDMNGKRNTKKDGNGETRSGRDYKSFKDIQRIINSKQIDLANNELKVNQDSDESSLQVANSDRKFLDRKNTDSKNNKSATGSKFHGNSKERSKLASGRGISKSENKKDKNSNNGQSGKNSAVREKYKDIVKVSAETSYGFFTKALMLVGGFVSTFVKQDIFFRLVLGVFLGGAFVALVFIGI